MNKEYTVNKNENILKVENVSLVLEDKLILRDINIQIDDVIRTNTITGQIVGFLGPSGRGKTQLFKILSGLREPTTGTVLVHGNPVRTGDVGQVAQNYPLFSHLKVWDNLLIALTKSKLTKKDKTDKINLYLERFKLSDKKDFYPARLSGGQRQRIAIIQQLLCSESFLLLDEPFSGLDINMIGQLSETILEIANMDELNTIIIVSHDIQSTVAIANEIWMLGFEQDKEGNNIAGATIKFVDDLMKLGLAWEYPHIFEMPEFDNYVKGIRKEFKLL